MRGCFRFLNQGHELSLSSLPWNDAKYSRLWRYHLHYFDYALDLCIWSSRHPENRPEAVHAFETLAARWIDQNPPANGDGWHPYTVSLRLVNWLGAIQQFGADLRERGMYSALLPSIGQQARYLNANLELDVRGNHVIENLRALVCCGLFFDGREAARWRQRALRLLEIEVQEQVLPDGGHFERTPGYHVAVLKTLIEIAVWLERGQENVPAWLRSGIGRMLDYLAAILPPSGQIPLLKDTARDAFSDPEGVLAAGALFLDEPKWKRSDRFASFPALLFGENGWQRFRAWSPNQAPEPSQSRPDTGYYVMRDDRRRDYLIFDAGKPCPDYLPAHAHADLLSYELIAGGQPVIVDSGVYEYTAGPWRDYFRSTRAHNTVEVAGENQSEVWGSFRVARRASPANVRWQVVGDQVLVQAEHDGYRRLAIPVSHRRTILWQQGQYWLVVDEVLGKGRTASTSYLHLHPKLRLEMAGDGVWRVVGGVQPFWITGFGHTSAAIVSGQCEPYRQGWHSERFGDLRPNDVLCLQNTDALSCCYGYVVALDEPAITRLSATGAGHVLNLAHGDTKRMLQFKGSGKIDLE